MPLLMSNYLFISTNRIFTLTSRCERPENQSSSHALYFYVKFRQLEANVNHKQCNLYCSKDLLTQFELFRATSNIVEVA